MTGWWADLWALVPGERIGSILRAVAILGVGYLGARLVSAWVVRAGAGRLDAQGRMILPRLAYWTVLGLAVAMTLHELGFQIGVLLGAAGILTVALGFASQTSASNLISGLFLIAERPFVVNDVVRIGNLTGEVLSVDALSVKIRTFDNLFVRVPNEEIIKTEITNLTYFPLRRVDVRMGVAYREDLVRVEEILRGVARQIPIALEDPSPLFIVRGFGESSMDFQFSVWGSRDRYLDLLNAVHIGIKKAFDEAGIEIPFPHRTLYPGSEAGPMPVRIVADPPDRPGRTGGAPESEGAQPGAPPA
jgi:small-conductance mechanosensitive channel